MGVAYYPEFERAVAGFDPAVAISGKSMASAMKQLDQICERSGQPTLTSFYSESNAESFKKIGERVPPGLREIPIVWSEPATGIRTALALIEFLKVNPNELATTEDVVQDLGALHQILLKAQENQTRFRLRIDF